MDDLIKKLRRSARVEVGEHLIEYAGEWHRIEPGDRYIGQHKDQKPELLTCRRREVQRRTSSRTTGKLFPKERKDSRGKKPRLYGLEEVIKVNIRNNPNYDPTKEQLNEQITEPTEPNPIEGETADVVGPVGAGTPEGESSERVGDERPAKHPSGPRNTPAVPVPGDPRTRAGRTDYTQPARAED